MALAPNTAGGCFSRLAQSFWVIGVRDDDADQPPVLIVEDVAG
ncbi:MAG TPA: hypothetical protein VHQ98_00755 [Gaiellaceae bacterium]|jgi:hypothetical protein|nr:hypothetical protein [Gaiellaceae bacterium]